MEDYASLPLFQGISGEELKTMLACFHARGSAYRGGERICEYDGTCREVGILLEGTARLVRIDIAGAQTILEHMGAGSVFGEVLGFTSYYGDSVSVVCEEDCRVLYLEYAHIMKRCHNACTYHSVLVQNMFSLVTGQICSLSRRVEVLSQRTIREKLMCYFYQLSSQAKSAAFSLPFSMVDLADYLSIDRSAMTRELKRMKDEGLVEMDRRRVRLLA